MIEGLTKILSGLSNQWACLLSNGYIIQCSIEDEQSSLEKLIQILRLVINEIEVGSVILVRDLTIYRITFNFFIFLKGQVGKNILKEGLLSIKNKYKTEIEHSFQDKQEIDKIKPNLVLFSMGLGEGPAPIEHVSSLDYSSEDLLKISMKTLLLLSVESEGASKSMISFQPYVEFDSLGIVILFQIKDENARGGAYDSAITLLVDYSLRAIIYDHYKRIETLLIGARDRIIDAYHTQGKDKYGSILTSLKEQLKSITFERKEKSMDLKEEMMQQIKKLAQL